VIQVQLVLRVYKGAPVRVVIRDVQEKEVITAQRETEAVMVPLDTQVT